MLDQSRIRIETLDFQNFTICHGRVPMYEITRQPMGLWSVHKFEDHGPLISFVAICKSQVAAFAKCGLAVQ